MKQEVTFIALFSIGFSIKRYKHTEENTNEANFEKEFTIEEFCMHDIVRDENYISFQTMCLDFRSAAKMLNE